MRAESSDLRVFLVGRDGRFPDVSRGSEDIVLNAKCDLRPGDDAGISGLTGAGADDLLDAISQVLGDRVGSVGTATRYRHKVAIERAIGAISDSLDQLAETVPIPELAAEELRHAISSLDSLIGKVGVEQLLDEIFSSFCVGK